MQKKRLAPHGFRGEGWVGAHKGAMLAAEYRREHFRINTNFLSGIYGHAEHVARVAPDIEQNFYLVLFIKFRVCLLASTLVPKEYEELAGSHRVETSGIARRHLG